MLRGLYGNLKKYFLMVCVFFSITTFISSVIQLAVQEKEFDSNVHILLRCFLCFLGAGFMVLFKYIKLKNRVLQEVVHYTLSLSILLLMVYCLSFFVELGGEHPYLDLALNYTGVYAFIVLGLYLKERRKKYS